MKKFFGLKMTLAALAVVSFASCYDSEGGDVIIPNQTSVVWPDPIYVVTGHVTAFQTGSPVADVKVADFATTDVNGDFSKTMNIPWVGDVDFVKEGYLRTTRALKMAIMETGTAVYNLDAVMFTPDQIAGALKEKDVEATPDTDKKVTATADALAAETGIDFTNNTDNQKVYNFWAGDYYFAGANGLPYGLKAVEAKSLEEDGQALFLKWFNDTDYHAPWGKGDVPQESPYSNYSIYYDQLTVVIPAQFKVTKINVTPIKTSKTLVFPLEEGDYEQPVEIYDSYQVTVEGESLDHNHGHGHGNGNGAGGGEGN